MHYFVIVLGYVHILWLREVGTEEKRRVHVWISISRRSRSELVLLCYQELVQLHQRVFQILNWSMYQKWYTSVHDLHLVFLLKCIRTMLVSLTLHTSVQGLRNDGLLVMYTIEARWHILSYYDQTITHVTPLWTRTKCCVICATLTSYCWMLKVIIVYRNLVIFYLLLTVWLDWYF